jgi:hypothetical protein
LIFGASPNRAGTLTHLVRSFDGMGDDARTNAYRINRRGERSTPSSQLGDHAIDAGLWHDRNESSGRRR